MDARSTQMQDTPPDRFSALKLMLANSSNIFSRSDCKIPKDAFALLSPGSLDLDIMMRI